MKNRFVSFDLTGFKDWSFDNFWKSVIEIVWNTSIPFLSGFMLFLYGSGWFFLGFLIPASFNLKIKRNTHRIKQDKISFVGVK